MLDEEELVCARRPRRPILDHAVDLMLDEGWREAFAALMGERMHLTQVEDALDEDVEDRLRTLAEQRDEEVTRRGQDDEAWCPAAAAPADHGGAQ